MSNPRPSLGFGCGKSILKMISYPCFNNLEFDIFYAGSRQFHFIVSVITAVKIQTLSVH